MSWRRRRQFSIILTVALVLALVGGVWYFLVKPEPSCFDGKKNQDEVGVDCGGPCSKVCLTETSPLSILWARAFEISPGSYSAVAYVENGNRRFGLPELPYEFILVDANGAELARVSGRTFANPQERFVVFHGNITAPAGRSARTFIEFPADLIWQRLEPQSPVLSVRKKSFATEPAPQLVAEAVNPAVAPISGIQVPVVLSDKEGNAISASATYINSIASGATVELYFTWPLSLAAPPVFFDFYPHENFFNVR